jgi:hypothetical protein
MAMFSISLMERKITTKSKTSVVAFQSAGTGIEWAMKKINDAEQGKTVGEIFGNIADDGKIECDAGSFFGNDSKSDCAIYLLGGSDQHRNIITSTDEKVDNIVAIRSVGSYGEAEQKVGRALEAYAMPNCGDDLRVADFCIEKTLNGHERTWKGAVVKCAERSKRLCTVTELMSTQEQYNSDLDEKIGDANENHQAEWTANRSGSTIVAIKKSGDFEDVPSDEGRDFRCCRNR